MEQRRNKVRFDEYELMADLKDSVTNPIDSMPSSSSSSSGLPVPPSARPGQPALTPSSSTPAQARLELVFDYAAHNRIFKSRRAFIMLKPMLRQLSQLLTNNTTDSYILYKDYADINTCLKDAFIVRNKINAKNAPRSVPIPVACIKCCLINDKNWRVGDDFLSGTYRNIAMVLSEDFAKIAELDDYIMLKRCERFRLIDTTKAEPAVVFTSNGMSLYDGQYALSLELGQSSVDKLRDHDQVELLKYLDGGVDMTYAIWKSIEAAFIFYAEENNSASLVIIHQGCDIIYNNLTEELIGSTVEQARDMLWKCQEAKLKKRTYLSADFVNVLNISGVLHNLESLKMDGLPLYINNDNTCPLDETATSGFLEISSDDEMIPLPVTARSVTLDEDRIRDLEDKVENLITINDGILATLAQIRSQVYLPITVPFLEPKIDASILAADPEPEKALESTPEPAPAAVPEPEKVLEPVPEPEKVPDIVPAADPEPEKVLEPVPEPKIEVSAESSSPKPTEKPSLDVSPAPQASLGTTLALSLAGATIKPGFDPRKKSKKPLELSQDDLFEL